MVELFIGFVVTRNTVVEETCSLSIGSISENRFKLADSNLDIETKVVKSTGRDSSAASNCHFADKLVEPAEDFRTPSPDIVF
jgi:hypothetical protein